MLSRLLEWLVLIFPQLDRACIFMADEAGRHLNPVAVHQGGGSSISGHTVRPISHLILRQVMGGGKAVLSVDRVVPDDQMNVLEQDYCSQMCAPLMGNTRKPFGVIYIDSDNLQQRFTPDDLNILTCVAILTGQALEQESQHSTRFRAVVDHRGRWHHYDERELLVRIGEPGHRKTLRIYQSGTHRRTDLSTDTASVTGIIFSTRTE